MTETKFAWAKDVEREDDWTLKFMDVMVGLSVYVGVPIVIICLIIWAIGIFSLPFPPVQ